MTSAPALAASLLDDILDAAGLYFPLTIEQRTSNGAPAIYITFPAHEENAGERFMDSVTEVLGEPFATVLAGRFTATTLDRLPVLLISNTRLATA